MRNLDTNFSQENLGATNHQHLGDEAFSNARLPSISFSGISLLAFTAMLPSDLLAVKNPRPLSAEIPLVATKNGINEQETLPPLIGNAPSIAEMHEGAIIKYPDGGAAWATVVKETISCCYAELAKFGMKPLRVLEIIIVGDQAEFDKAAPPTFQGSDTCWHSGDNRIVVVRAPLTKTQLVLNVSNGIAGISAYASQGRGASEITVPDWLVRGVQTQVVLANAGRIAGIQAKDTPTYMRLVDNYLELAQRPSLIEMLGNKEARVKGHFESPLAATRLLMTLLTPAEGEKKDAARAQSFRSLVTKLIVNEQAGEESKPEQILIVAGQIVQALELDDWLKKASKNTKDQELLLSLGIDITSKKFRARLKEKSGDKDIATLEAYLAFQTEKAREHAENLRKNELTTPKKQ